MNSVYKTPHRVAVNSIALSGKQRKSLSLHFREGGVRLLDWTVSTAAKMMGREPCWPCFGSSVLLLLFSARRSVCEKSEECTAAMIAPEREQGLRRTRWPEASSEGAGYYADDPELR